MTLISQLKADITALLNESKRRNTDIKHGCELALETLASETSIDSFSDTSKSRILQPVLISCNTNNPRFVNISIPIIHKLIICDGINPQDLSPLLKSLLEASHLAIDIQLKILQCLPSLMQIYNKHITGELLLNLLVICSSLTSNNKSTVVINTASATLQQVFNYIYERISIEVDETAPDVKAIKLEDKEFKLDGLCYEGYMIFSDLCKMLDNDTPDYLKNVSIKAPAILEVIESVLHNKELFSKHTELNHIIRIKLIPIILRIINADEDFPLVIRSMRILLLLLTTQLENLVIEGEIILSILNHLLLDNPHYTGIVLEIFRALASNFHTMKLIYELYDSNSKKKNVIHELFSIISTYLQYNPSIRKESLQIPVNNQQVFLSSKHSTIKIAILDLLDKQELPQVPETYPTHVILNILTSFTDGIAKFVHNLSNDNLENDLEFINNLIKVVYPQVFQIFKCFIYSLMDNDNFHALIRSLQKFTHTTGLLGLNDLRDGLLELLATSIISDTFNSRHVTCLRALINLAISLGSTLTDSWRIIWTTLQWSDFLINGPNEFSNYKLEFTPSLSSVEVNNIKNSMNKFYDSIEEYPVDSYKDLIESLIKMYYLQDQQEGKEETETSGPSFCPYNKIYFVNKLYEISRRNGIKYPETFKTVSQFYINTGVNNGNLNFKKYIIGQYNSIIKSLALNSLNGDQSVFNKTNELCLEGLDDLVTELNSHETTELLILNNQFEIHQIILDTLTELLENYKNTNDQSWFIIFKIINNPFKFQNSDKIVPLLNSSFNCLKIILNEFIVGLPVNTYKVLIDTLYNFCVQETDLNISFSSISYFWLIGDSVKKLQEQEVDSSSSIGIKTEEDLLKVIDTKMDFKSLDVYLLLNLIKLSNNERDQVRNGAIQTFFEIIDIHGQVFNDSDWLLTYDIILKKIFEINDNEDTVKLKFDGIINLSNKFNSHFGVEVWQSLFAYMQQLIELNQMKINIILLDKFNDILHIPVDKQVVELLFNFWIDFPIEYNFVNPESFIDSLVSLNKSFPLLYNKLEAITESDLNRILNLLTRCLMYPIILRLDDKRPTPLQQAVFDNLGMIDLKDNDLLNCILIKELSNLLVYQYKVREKIESKLTNLKMKFKLPTFISISNSSFELLQVVLQKVVNFQSLIESNTIVRVFKSLLNVIENKSIGTDEASPLWDQCSQFLLSLTEKLVKYDFNSEIWSLILDAIRLCYNNPDYESKNLEQFDHMTKLILPHMKDQQIIEHFLSEMYLNSYLYEKNDIEQELMSEDLDQTIHNLIHYPFEESFGSTAPIQFYKVNKMKLLCLKKLIQFTVQDNTFQSPAIKYFMLRVSFSLRRLIEQTLLSYKLPVSMIQINELKLMLEGLLDYLKLNSQPTVDMGIIKLLVKVVGINRDIDSFVEAILLQLNHL